MKYIYSVITNVIADDTADIQTNIVPIDPCLSNPCKNNGTCLKAFANSFACLCLPNFLGKRHMICLCIIPF